VGCISLEADLWIPGIDYVNDNALGDDDLMVGHKRSSFDPDRTLRGLYLQPLERILGRMNQGSGEGENMENVTRNGVFSSAPEQTLILLLDFKEKEQDKIEELWFKMQNNLDILRGHKSELSYLSYASPYSGERMVRPITVVVTGAANFSCILDETMNPYGDIFFDAPLDNLDTKNGDVYDTTNSHMASTSLSKTIGKPSGLSGKFSTSQLEKISSLTGAAKAKGLVVRFWDTPSWPVSVRGYVWKTLLEKGVGVLNVDELSVAVRWDWGGKWVGWCWILRGLIAC
jgi:hypothetical protein